MQGLFASYGCGCHIGAQTQGLFNNTDSSSHGSVAQKSSAGLLGLQSGCQQGCVSLQGLVCIPWLLAPFSIFQVSSSGRVLLTWLHSDLRTCLFHFEGRLWCHRARFCRGGHPSITCSRRTRHSPRCRLLTPDWVKSENNGPSARPSGRGGLRRTVKSGASNQPGGKRKGLSDCFGRRGRPKAILSFTSHSLWGNELSTEYSLPLAGQGGAGSFFAGKA